MKINFKKILEAYTIKISPTKEQKNLALKRLDICSGCEFLKGDIESRICSCAACGCFIHGKIFTNEGDECPKGKWSTVDQGHFKTKVKNTLI
tara:strand:- start:15259 stop:15534 length:276 start_codon:yes stop_codon:yes gene_type:complete